MEDDAMPELMTLTATTFDEVLRGKQPALVLFSSGDGLRSEFSAAFKKAASEHADIVFATLDPASYPQAAVRFEVGSKPLLIGLFNGNEILRRPRPWGADVPLAIEMLQAAAKAVMPAEQEKVIPPVENKPVPNNKPVIVTDATFEAEVLNSELPVLVDFWAEWCGPCRMVAPTLEKLAGEFAGQVRIAKVNVDENPGLSQAFRVMSIPTIMLIKNRTIVFNQPGALPEPAFRDIIQQLIALDVPMPAVPEQPAQ
jgi:thioredoxin 1